MKSCRLSNVESLEISKLSLILQCFQNFGFILFFYFIWFFRFYTRNFYSLSVPLSLNNNFTLDTITQIQNVFHYYHYYHYYLLYPTFPQCLVAVAGSV